MWRVGTARYHPEGGSEGDGLNSNLNASAALDQETGNPRKPVTPPHPARRALSWASAPSRRSASPTRCCAWPTTAPSRRWVGRYTLHSAAAQQNVAEESPPLPEDGTWSTDKIRQPAFVPKVAQALPSTSPAVTEPLAAFMEPQTFSTMMARFNKLYKRRYGFGLKWVSVYGAS